MTLGLDESLLLLDALRPPARMRISAAVGTTFTLDLAALLAIPVAASLDQEHADDPADLLETIRRYSERTVLFCQAGAIGVPVKYRAALTFVEQTVIEVRKPTGGIFHPKVWAIRYEGGGRSLHRVLVATRNLTFDRAWDAIVRLDEDPACENAVDLSGLIDLLGALPALAARKPTSHQSDLLAGLLHSLRSAHMAVPEPFTTGTTIPINAGRRGYPFARRCDNALAVSPFLTADAVSAFVGTAEHRSIVVSRRASLNATASALRGVDRVLRIKNTVLAAQESADIALNGDSSSSDGASTELAAMRGLHAKIYVQDDGGEATTWLGSANLTSGGFHSNIEMVLQLTGPRLLVGVDALLDPKGERRDLSRLVEPHELPIDDEVAPEPEDGISELDALAYEMASHEFTLTLTPSASGWNAQLAITPWQPPVDTTVRARPLSIRSDYAPITDGIAQWQCLDLTAITPFLVIEVTKDQTARTMLVRADLIGDPADRRGSVLARAIASREDFMRYLAALLGYDTGTGILRVDGGGTFAGWGADGFGADRILEDLLTTAARNPERLKSLDETLKYLDARSETREFVPPEFRALWEAVYAARRNAIR